MVVTQTISTTTAVDGGAPELAARIAAACAGQEGSMSSTEMMAGLQAKAPELKLRYGMVRAGWHRLGGIVDGNRRPVADQLADWAQARSGGDLEVLMSECARVGGFVTRLEGRTHYLTAVTGDRAQDFIQIEIEQLQEVIDRPLWDPEWMPDDLEDFIDPLDVERLDPEPLGQPRLVLRRVLNVADFHDSEDAGRDLKRFLHDWDRSSAGECARFCDHWCLGIRQYRDTRRVDRLGARPIAFPGTGMLDLPDEAVSRGATLAKLIHGFDRHRGYHFAWYFHMLTQRRVSYRLAEAVHADLMGAFDYLPARDIAVLRDWYDAPYSI
jgi:hypothetical protein